MTNTSPTIPTPPSPPSTAGRADDPFATTSVSPDEAPGAPRVLATLNDDGSRRWIRPKVSKGRFLTGRRVVAYVLIAIFTLIPYLRLHDKPLVLLDLTTRRFIIFGKTFLPTDTLLLALLLVGIFLGIFFITALFGRVWCGWACPQTVYMEFVFRPLERLFEGAPGRTSKSWIARSGFGKILRPLVYLGVSMYLAHTFLAYFVGVDKLAVWVTQSPLQHPTPFMVMAVVTGLMMFDFLYFREQMCIVACPYGRLQSALLDRQSLIVGYDRARGEPRGKVAKGKAAAEKAEAARQAAARGDIQLPVISSYETRTGDCVDCGLCVTTCPTGIDIRNGLQMECIGCAQCIDACDAVMTKLNRPRGLIRYSSQARLSGEKPHMLRVRTLIYPALLTVIAAAFIFLLLTQAPANVTVLRGLGRPYTELPDGSVENSIRVKIFNRTDQTVNYKLSATDERGLTRLVAEETPASVSPGESKTFSAIILAPGSAFSEGAFKTVVHVSAEGVAGGFKRDVKYTLQGPMSPHHADDDKTHRSESHDHDAKPDGKSDSDHH
jgi:cytochrome c oxidase accessory protein FixG